MRDANNKPDELNIGFSSIQSDLPTTELERISECSARFDRYTRALKQNGWAELDMPPEMLALTALGDLEKMLRASHLTPNAASLLADFIGSIGAMAQESENSDDEEGKLALRILGFKQLGRPSASLLAQNRAVAVFEHYLGMGNSEEVALALAHDAYQAAMGRPAEKLLRGKKFVVPEENQTITKGAKVMQVSTPERFIEFTLKPMLRRSGALPPKKRGPKPRE